MSWAVKVRERGDCGARWVYPPDRMSLTAAALYGALMALRHGYQPDVVEVYQGYPDLSERPVLRSVRAET